MLPYDDAVFKGFAFYGSISLVKMMGLALWTGKTKRATQSFVNPEDAQRQGVAPATSENKDVERVQRAHRNDVENLLPFLGLGIFYCASRPDPVVALWHFRAFALGRFIHSIAYLNERGIERAFGFMLGAVVCVSMAVQNVMYYAVSY